MATEEEDNGYTDELELLRCMYDASELSLPDETRLPMTAKLKARPCVAGNDSHVFCSLYVHFTLPERYPSAPASVTFSNPRGFDDAELVALKAELLEISQQNSALATVHLFEMLDKVREKVTELNEPNPCPVCCEEISISDVGGIACLRLEPCWHSMHAHCFIDFLQFRITHRDEREQHLRTTMGKIGAREKAFENWICCPVCMSPIDFEAAKSAASNLSKDGERTN